MTSSTYEAPFLACLLYYGSNFSRTDDIIHRIATFSEFVHTSPGSITGKGIDQVAIIGGCLRPSSPKVPLLMLIPCCHGNLEGRL